MVPFSSTLLDAEEQSREILSRLYFALHSVPVPGKTRVLPVKGGCMRVSLKALTLSSAILWGFLMLFVGLVHMAAPSYGTDFLRMMSSVYPGADTAPTLGRVLLGTIYGFVDGAIFGCVFGLLYGVMSHPHGAMTKSDR
jgi:hypothetical protein